MLLNVVGEQHIVNTHQTLDTIDDFNLMFISRKLLDTHCQKITVYLQDGECKILCNVKPLEKFLKGKSKSVGC